MTAPQHAAQRQFLALIEGIPDYWAGKTGAEESADVTKSYDGGSLLPQSIGSPPTLSNIVLTRPWAPARDMRVRQQLKGQSGSLRRDVVIFWTDENLVPLSGPGSRDIYPKCLLAAHNPPDGDAASGTGSTYSTTWSPDNVVE
jgi:hypothetical protein